MASAKSSFVTFVERITGTYSGLETEKSRNETIDRVFVAWARRKRDRRVFSSESSIRGCRAGRTLLWLRSR